MRAAAIVLTLVALALAALWFAGGERAVPDRIDPTSPSANDESTADAAIGAIGATSTAATAPARDLVAAPRSAYEQLLADTATGYTGRVVTPAGEPVPDMQVALLRAAATAALPAELNLFESPPAAPRLVAATATTDAEGRFVLSGVAPRGLCVLRLTFSDVDAAPPRFRAGNGTYAPVQAAPAPGEVAELGDVVLEVGATVVGRVTDPDGPVGGALVRAARLPPFPFGAVPIERLRPDGGLIGTPGGDTVFAEMPPWFGEFYETLPIVATTSRADGTFTLYGVDPGKVVVAATATARASCLKQDVACGSGQTVNVGDLYLTYGSTTRVEVVDGEGEPIAGARVFVAASSFGIPAHIAEPAGVTDERGVVEHEGLPVGLALAAAQRPNDAAWHVGESGSAEGTLRVVIPSRHSLTLAVVDTNGQPVARPRLRLVAGHQGHGVLELALFGAQQSVDLGRRLRRLDDGRLGITELDGGPWTVCVGAEGFATAVEEIELAGDVERTIELRPARELTVRTVDGTGEPVADATIYVRSRGGSRAERIVDLPVPSGRTGRDGVCRVRDLPTELTRITAMHPAFGQVHTEVEGRPAELVLRFVTPASIHGTLTDGGRVPEPGRWVVVLERRYDDPSERRGAMPEMPQLALPDLDGRFRFAALQPGSWRVTAQDSVADVGTVAGIHDYLARRKNIFPWNKADVALQGGVDVEVRLDAIVDAAPFEGPGATVQGHVSIDGVPAIGAIVVGTTKNPERRVTSRVNLAGSFDLGRVPAGELQVVVVSADVADSRLKENLFSHLYSRRFRIEPDRPLGLPIAIATGSVFGELRDDAGAPVAGARIGLHDRGNAERSSALRVMRTDSQGGFDFAGVPVGLYELRAEATGRSATRSGIAVAAGARVGPLDVRLVRLAELHGQVVPDRPIGPEGAVLVLHPLDRGAAARPQRATVGPDGSFSVRAIAVGEYRAELVRDGARTPFGTVRVTLPKTEGVLLRPSG